MATSHDDVLHVKPVSFIFIDGMIIIATDYKMRAYVNIKSNSQAGVVIDIYKSGEHEAVCVQGKVKVIKNGFEFKKLHNMFYQKFVWVRRITLVQSTKLFQRLVL